MVVIVQQHLEDTTLTTPGLESSEETCWLVFKAFMLVSYDVKNDCCFIESHSCIQDFSVAEFGESTQKRKDSNKEEIVIFLTQVLFNTKKVPLPICQH